MKFLYKNKHWNFVKDCDIDKILYLLIDRPTRITFYKNVFWENEKKQSHRDYNLPAFIRNDGSLEWYKNDNFYKKINKCC